MSDTSITSPVERYHPPADQVKQLQTAMTQAGLYKGPISGTWDDATWQALLQFQGQHRLSTSGEIDVGTLGVLKHGTQAPQADPGYAAIMAQYGPGWAAYADDPEMGPILKDLAAKRTPPSDPLFIGRLANTARGRAEGASARAWELTSAGDPGTANERRQTRLGQIKDLATRLGLKADDHLLGEVAEDSLRFGWTDPVSGGPNAQAQKMLVSLGSYDPKAPGGLGGIGVQIQTLREKARAYFLSPTDAELLDQARRIEAGLTTEDAAVGTFKAQAKSNHPYLGQAIDAGQTVADYFADTRSKIAQMMEQPVDSIDLMNDHRWWPVIGFGKTSGDKQSIDGKPMSTSEMIQYVNQQPGADQTERLRSNAADLALLFDRTFTGRSS